MGKEDQYAGSAKPPSERPDIARARIEDDVAAFLAAGGEIEEVPPDQWGYKADKHMVINYGRQAERIKKGWKKR